MVKIRDKAQLTRRLGNLIGTFLQLQMNTEKREMMLLKKSEATERKGTEEKSR